MDTNISSVVLQLFFVVAVLGYGIVLSRFVPDKLHWPANALAVVVTVGLGMAAGLSLNDMGLGLQLLLPGLTVAAIASLAVFCLVLGANVIPYIRKHFLKQTSIINSSNNRLIFDTVIRIPLSTALVEEILFRGVLLGVFMHYQPTLLAIINSSIVFGLWHIAPTLTGMRMNNNHTILSAKSYKLAQTAHVGAYVVATACAGIGFSWLRVLSGSISAPWLLHWTVNVSGILAVVLANQLMKRDNHRKTQ